MRTFTRRGRDCHLGPESATPCVEEDRSVQTLASKLTEPAVVAFALYRELWTSALRLLPRRDRR